MKVTVDLPDWIVAELLAWRIPDGIAGPTIEDRIQFLAQDAAEGLQSAGERERLYRLFDVIPDDDDDIPL